jgi:nitrile hydratase subunit beta
MARDIGRALAPIATWLPEIAAPLGQTPLFAVGDRIRVFVRFPVGHYRVPNYIRGKLGMVEQVIEPRAVNNEEEGYGRNAGSAGFYYRVAIPLTLLWTDYAGSPKDGLRIEIFETWLERA